MVKLCPTFLRSQELIKFIYLYKNIVKLYPSYNTPCPIGAVVITTIHGLKLVLYKYY